VRSRGIALALILAGAGAVFAKASGPAKPSASAKPLARRLRVCADPNNMPFSSMREDGIESAIARIVARDLSAEIDYVWMPQRRGFVRHTLSSGLCDVMLEAPADYGRVLATRPYYRSTYVFVSRRDGGVRIRSFDDPALSRLRIGVQIVGDDYANTPPAHALGRRGLASNVLGFSLYGNYEEPNPPSRIIDAVARGDVDVAVAWGPMAGYFASRETVPLDLAAVSTLSSGEDGHFQFDIAMGVRRGDAALRDELDRVLVRRRGEIDAVLRRFHVPLIGAPAAGR
jgi:mxaJ protein